MAPGTGDASLAILIAQFTALAFARRRGRGAGRPQIRHRAAIARAPDSGRGRGEERRLPLVPHRHRSIEHAQQPGREAGLHGLPRRRCESHVGRRRRARSPSRTPRPATRRTCCRGFPESWHFPSSANPERTYSLLNQREPGVHPLHQSGRLPHRARGVRRVPSEDDSGGRAQPDVARPPCSGAARRTTTACCRTSSTCSARRTRETARPPFSKARRRSNADKEKHGLIDKLYPLPRWENLAPADVFRVFERGGRNLSNVFAETGLPNVARPDPAARRARPPGLQAVEPRPRHRRAHRRAGAQHPQDAPQRSARRGSSARTTSPATIAPPVAPRATWCTRTIATRGTPARTRSSATGA